MADGHVGFIVGGLFAGGIALCIIAFCQSEQDASWRKQIAQHGCAEYYLDQNFEKQWRWKNETQKTTERKEEGDTKGE